MTDTQQVKPIPHKNGGGPKNRIPTPITQALLAGSVASGISFIIGVPVDYVPRVAVAGASYSLWLSWMESRTKTAPKKKRSRQIPYSYGSSSTKIDMEFSTSTGGYITRENPIRRFIFGNPKPTVRSVEPVSRPNELDEFVFHSKGLQLREKHVKLFLASAWRNRANGKGLSARQWVRNANQRPAWYQELNPTWYYAMMSLLRQAGNYTGWHLIVRYDNGWLSLVEGDLRLTLNIMKWYEWEKNAKRK